ncbi:MAG: GTP cyclohydrolase II [Alphaproteobacteria bacterium]|nr:GTP cyclohydrolase II [Alphaproteobacteria bacterium]
MPNHFITNRIQAALKQGDMILLTHNQCKWGIIASETIDPSTFYFLKNHSIDLNFVLSNPRIKSLEDSPIFLNHNFLPSHENGFTLFSLDTSTTWDDLQSFINPIVKISKADGKILPQDKKGNKIDQILLDKIFLLVKKADLLPSFIFFKIEKQDESIFNSFFHLSLCLNIDGAILKDITLNQEEILTQIAEANLPLAHNILAKILVFRTSDHLKDHLAILVNYEPSSNPVSCRIHSSCFTGDLLASLRCDCGEQLHQALITLSQNDGGVLLYLNQEGRGIGLINKLRSYQLQDQGIDTYQANQFLGFDADERSYETAATILKMLNITTINLLTNSPQKINHMEKNGIHVANQTLINIKPNTHNKNYLQAKQEKMNHKINFNK